MDQIICQSCAMPMEPEMYGTNKDGSKNADYCKYCFENGAFTSDQTMEQMIETCIPFMTESGEMTAEQARGIMESALPQLKRWKN